jgi:hypothetical protein
MNASPLTLSDLTLRVSADGRFLERAASGGPFLWIGDTAWKLFHRLDREEALHYLDRRAAQGFSVIQAVALAETDGLRAPNAYGEVPLIDLDPKRPNERYFEHVDFVVRAANERGLIVALLPTWGDKVPSTSPGGPAIFDARNAEVYGRFLGQRYGDAGIVWMLGGDRGIDTPEVLEIWRAMARGIRERDAVHLMTFHPRGDATSAWWVHNESWLDFNVFQSGHVARFLPVHRFAEEMRLMRPRKPFLDAEPPYEDIAVRFWDFVKLQSDERVPPGVLDETGRIANRAHFAEGFFTDYDVRVHAYRNLLSGSCGYTYGNNAVWQMWRPGRPAIIPCLHDWRTALERPGVQQLRHLRALFTACPFHRLRPDQSLVFGPNPDGPEHVRAASAEDRSFALVYLSRPKPVIVATAAMGSARLETSWFDPRTGESIHERAVVAGGLESFSPPARSDGDWVLTMRKGG